MKNILLTLLFFISIVSSYAQGWEEVGTGANALKANSIISSICYDKGNGSLYAAGGFSDGATSSSGNKYVAKWNGTSWQCLCSDVSSLRFLSGTSPICVDKYHNVYSTGFVDTLGEYIVVKWDGAMWHTLGEGLTSLNAEGNIFGMCTDNVGNLYVAGMFTNAAGYYYVAKWDGVSWSELGTGSSALKANNWINALAVDKHDNIYAAGWFDSLGYQYVAKWDGFSWQRVGSGINPLNFSGAGGISALYIDDYDNIYAGGVFRNVDGYQYVSKWNGTDWSELGTGINKLQGVSFIETVTGDKWGNVYAAGLLSGGKFYVAKWDGTTWAEIGTGSNRLNANGDIYTICADTSGVLYAAGMFTDREVIDSGYRYVASYKVSSDVEYLHVNSLFSVYPNPVDNHLFINSILSNIKYIIYNIKGDLVGSGVYNISNMYVDVSNLKNGIHFIKIEEFGITINFYKK